MRNYFDWHIDNSVNDLKNLFDMVDIPNDLFEFLEDHSLLNYSFDLSYVSVFVSHLNDLLVLFHNFFDLFDNDWNFDDLLNDALNVSVDVDKLRNDPFDFNDLWDFYNFFSEFFYFINFGNNS